MQRIKSCYSVFKEHFVVLIASIKFLLSTFATFTLELSFYFVAKQAFRCFFGLTFCKDAHILKDMQSFLIVVVTKCRKSLCLGKLLVHPNITSDNFQTPRLSRVTNSSS